MGGRNNEVGACLEADITRRKGTTMLPFWTATESGATVASVPSAHVVMSGQTSLQQEGFCLTGRSAFIMWQGMCAIALIPAPPCFATGMPRGAADTANPCARSTSPSRMLMRGR